MLGLLGAGLSSVTAQAATYNATTQFSVRHGPSNGVWRYTADGATLGDRSSSGGIDSWHTGKPHFEASVTRNVAYGNRKLQPEDSVYIPDQVLNLDPQGLSEVDVEFRAPRTGRYRFSGTFLGDDDGTGSQGYIPAHDVGVLVGGVSVYAGTIYRFQQALGFSGLADLVAGESIAFAVHTATDTNNLGTGLAASVISEPSTAVPEPADWVLMIAGGAAVGAGARARREAMRRRTASEIWRRPAGQPTT